jgi:hypothetical protein
VTLSLTTVLPWERMTRWRYHVEKGAHSAFIGLVLYAVLPFDLLQAMVGGAVLYLVIGKLTVGRSHHPAPWLELLDWISDLIIGLAGAALAIWQLHGVVLGVVAVVVWLLLYALVTYRWAVP